MTTDYENLLDENAKKTLNDAKNNYGTEIIKKAIKRAWDDNRDKATQSDIQHVLNYNSLNTKNTLIKTTIFIITSVFTIIGIIFICNFINSTYQLVNITDPQAIATYHAAAIGAGALIGISLYQWVIKDFLNIKLKK